MTVPSSLYNVGEIDLDYRDILIENVGLGNLINILLVILINYLNNSLSSALSFLNIVITRSISRINTIIYVNIPSELNISKAWLSLLLVKSYVDSL